MLYHKQEGARGNWIKSKDLTDGMRAKLVSETLPQESVYEGKPRTQNVAKIRFEDREGVFNISINKTTINALIDAFGEDSKNWINYSLTIKTDRAQIAGKRVIVVYLLPEGYELTENERGYIAIVNPTKVVTSSEDSQVNNDEVNEDEIPF